MHPLSVEYVTTWVRHSSCVCMRVRVHVHVRVLLRLRVSVCVFALCWHCICHTCAMCGVCNMRRSKTMLHSVQPADQAL